MKRIFTFTCFKCIIFALSIILLPSITTTSDTLADSNAGNISRFSMSPMHEKVVLSPGETYTSSFRIQASNTITQPFFYSIYTRPYYRDSNNQAVFTEHDNLNQIVNWTSIDSPVSGSLEPGEATTIYFTIRAPEDAPAGGQYMTITVGSDTTKNGSVVGGINVQESIAMGYTIYAEITGTITRQGEIISANVPSFLLSGNIAGSSTIKNTGNTHGEAKYTLQVFPLFSDEEIYTNEENPDNRLILPDRSLYNETAWKNTPAIGIYNVIYSVDFEGVTTQIKKLVIKCPIWLLFLATLSFIFLVIWIISRSRSHRQTKHSCPNNNNSKPQKRAQAYHNNNVWKT